MFLEIFRIDNYEQREKQKYNITIGMESLKRRDKEYKGQNKG